jgi:hypothetical protein
MGEKDDCATFRIKYGARIVGRRGQLSETPGVLFGISITAGRKARGPWLKSAFRRLSTTSLEIHIRL